MRTVGLWLPEPDVDRVVDGLPSELDVARLRALGNAVVPQVVEVIGRAILTVDALQARRTPGDAGAGRGGEG